MTTHSGHTPGPWRVGDAGHTVFGPPNGNPSPETIAHVAKRNARLIAAAPELLKAVRAAALAIRLCKPLGTLDGTISHAERLLSAAIAKAEGREG